MTASLPDAPEGCLYGKTTGHALCMSRFMFLYYGSVATAMTRARLNSV